MDVSLDDELRERKEILRDLGIPTLPAVWLRPEPRPSAGVFTSKIGGQIAWPEDIPWPVCDVLDIPFDSPLDEQNDYYVPIAQFRRDEFPEISFPGMCRHPVPRALQLSRFPCSSMFTACSMDPASATPPELTK
jgi:hypothetical protein